MFFCDIIAYCLISQTNAGTTRIAATTANASTLEVQRTQGCFVTVSRDGLEGTARKVSLWPVTLVGCCELKGAITRLLCCRIERCSSAKLLVKPRLLDACNSTRPLHSPLAISWWWNRNSRGSADAQLGRDRLEASKSDGHMQECLPDPGCASSGGRRVRCICWATTKTTTCTGEKQTNML